MMERTVVPSIFLRAHFFEPGGFVPNPAILALQDGTIFEGISIGAEGMSPGEVVFNTSMTGYQEILTDPSYCNQLITLTYPHIGNTGVNNEDEEARHIHASGLIIRDLPLLASNWRSLLYLHFFLLALFLFSFSVFGRRPRVVDIYRRLTHSLSTSIRLIQWDTCLSSGLNYKQEVEAFQKWICDSSCRLVGGQSQRCATP